MLKTNLISYWKMDESSGNAADSFGVNTLTNNGTLLYGAAKINNGALTVSATGMYLSIADASQTGLDVSGDFSISAWIKHTVTSREAWLSKFNTVTGGNQMAYLFNMELDGLLFQISKDGQEGSTHETRAVVQFPTNFDTTSFYHFALIYDSSDGSLAGYINGALKTTSYTYQDARAVFNSSSPFRIGAGNENGAIFNGIIDEVAMWSRQITALEVAEIYNAGAGLPFGDWDAGGGGSSNPGWSGAGMW